MLRHMLSRMHIGMLLMALVNTCLPKRMLTPLAAARHTPAGCWHAGTYSVDSSNDPDCDILIAHIAEQDHWPEAARLAVPSSKLQLVAVAAVTMLGCCQQNTFQTVWVRLAQCSLPISTPSMRSDVDLDCNAFITHTPEVFIRAACR